jgi:hypothetical protein
LLQQFVRRTEQLITVRRLRPPRAEIPSRKTCLLSFLRSRRMGSFFVKSVRNIFLR